MGRYGVLAAGVAAVMLLHFVRMTDDPRTAMCWLRRTTGIPCPTCGMTRAFSALAKGDVRHAVAYNPLSPLFAVVILSCWGYTSWRMARGGAFPAFDGRRAAIVFAALGALAAVVWIVRVVVPLARDLGGAS